VHPYRGFAGAVPSGANLLDEAALQNAITFEVEFDNQGLVSLLSPNDRNRSTFQSRHP
jgi:hypothetical protein